MAKNTPIITHIEVLCFAIRHIDAEIETWKNRCEGKGPGSEQIAKTIIAPLATKKEALREMYRFETGVEYVD